MASSKFVMTENLNQARETIRRCRELRDAGKVEAVLRSELQSALRVIFPEDEDRNWINHYVEGAEARTKIVRAGGLANRFIDNLVGLTTIEYEPDLRNEFKRAEGYAQVHEHAAGLIRAGVLPSLIRGILSDTVEWYAYDVYLRSGVRAESCTPDDVSLVQIDELSATVDDEATARRLVAFIRSHLARQQSRPLRAEYLALDLGLDSALYGRSFAAMTAVVAAGRKSDPSIELATSLWSHFVDHLEDSAETFRIGAYVDELYVAILARLMTANVLAGRALLCDDATLKTILDGRHFVATYQLENLVEQDYFGWLSRRQYADKLAPIAREIQLDLYAYDFSRQHEQDLFGRLMAQLARRSHRKLLGQEWTPSWLARQLADRCIQGLALGEQPHFIDMCCGSGTIIAEVLNAAREKLGLAGLAQLQGVATGFDIDPLAVTLSKATWVVTLSDEIRAAKGSIVIPIYHADSLFAVTPVSATVPLVGESDFIAVSLDGETIQLPNIILQPKYRELFDKIVDWAYDEARHAKTTGNAAELTPADATRFLETSMDSPRLDMTHAARAQLADSVFALAKRMSELAVRNRNGIWAFILRNTYRPGLLTGQFNGLVSNPPWLALSGLSDNPYRAMLTQRARLYGIRPSGQSFLHLELGTTHLIHAVDRYLKAGASIACLVPGSILNGNHHEPLRQRNYLTSKRAIPFEVSEVWEIAHGTFKYPGAALIGHKRGAITDVNAIAIAGYVAAENEVRPVALSVQRLGKKRTAWVLQSRESLERSDNAIRVPQQGADLMPRTAVCIDILDDAEPERRVETPKSGSPWQFTLKSAKELKAERFSGRVAPEFIYRMAQSENLLHFVLGQQCAPIALPVTRANGGSWQILDEATIRRMGYTQTARWFATINDKLRGAGKGKSLQSRIDERGKLTKQHFGTSGYLVLAGAGGKHIAAACVPVENARDLIIDQTLYWQVVNDEAEAWFRVGMLNSHALTEAIRPFNPKGDFGERHIHTLPYRVMPPFDPANELHVSIARLAVSVAADARRLSGEVPSLCDLTRALPTRRTVLRGLLQKIPSTQQLEQLCAQVLGVVHSEGQPHSGLGN
jgi:hypothetical protein